MHGAAMVFARRFRREGARLAGLRGIFASSLLDAAALRGLLPAQGRRLPLLFYCHENQLTYPVRTADRRDEHYAWVQVQSALAADRVLWNSAFNQESFLEALPRFVRRMPDARPRGLAEAVAARSEVLPVPLPVAEIGVALAGEPARTGPCRIVWNHRWEHDKGPELMVSALVELAEQGLPFEVAVLGPAFERRPAAFERAQELLGERIVAWGHVEDRAAYLRELARSDVALSTARHEFQGLAVLEAAAAGGVPLVPDALAYREIWPPELRYGEGTLTAALRERIDQLERWRAYDPRPFARPFDWSALLPRWREVLSESGAESEAESGLG
jgi:glycosyltransferase involved in cell wall biosynthesis